MSQQQKRDIWFEHVRRAQRAGGSLAAYARSIQVAPRVMYYWGEAVRRQGMRVATAPRAKQSVVPSFAAVRVEPIPKSNASPNLLAHISVGKYADGLPLHRLEHVLGRAGVYLPRQTAARWMIQCGELVQPLINLMWDQLLSQPLIHGDETTVQVLKEPDKPPTSKSYMWAFAAGPPERTVILFDYHPTRSGEVPKRLLSGFRGYLMTDGYEGYNELAAQPGIEHLCCLVHARRRFRDAQRAQPKGFTGRADEAMAFFGTLQRLPQRFARVCGAVDPSVAVVSSPQPRVSQITAWPTLNPASNLPPSSYFVTANCRI